MPCFLMDLRFATGRQQKNRTFRFFSGAALSLHVRSKSLGVCKCKRDEVGSVASRMCAMCKRKRPVGVASRMCASAIERY